MPSEGLGFGSGNGVTKQKTCDPPVNAVHFPRNNLQL